MKRSPLESLGRRIFRWFFMIGDFNPSEKYMFVKLDFISPGFGVKTKKSLSCQHLVLFLRSFFFFQNFNPERPICKVQIPFIIFTNPYHQIFNRREDLKQRIGWCQPIWKNTSSNWISKSPGKVKKKRNHLEKKQFAPKKNHDLGFKH